MTHANAPRVLILATAGLALVAGGCTPADRIATSPIAPPKPQVAALVRPARPASASPTGAMRTIRTYPEYESALNDIPSLKKASTLIVRGQVVATSYFDWHTMTNTRVTLQVMRSNNPGVSAGSTVTVIESGGITTEANLIRNDSPKHKAAITPEMEHQFVEILFDGSPVPKVGDEALYFLNDSEQMKGVPGHHYIVVGAVQGKFNIKNGFAERYTADGSGGGMRPLRMPLETLESEAIGGQ